jgi:hypothetical protein
MNAAASSSAVPPISPMRTIPENMILTVRTIHKWDGTVLTGKGIWRY